MFKIPDPDDYLSASDVKDVAEEVIAPLPLPGVEGSPLDPGDIWLVVILACVNQNSIWDTCNDTNGTPCDDTVLTWLHTLDRDWLEFVANLLLGRLAMTILDPDRSRIVSIDFIDNPYHGEYYDDDGELCTMAPKDGTTTCHRYCTAYVVSNGKPVTLAMTYVRSDEDEADAGEHALARVENYPFEIDLLLADSGFYNERVIRRARDIAATVVHVPKKGERMKDKLDTHKSYMTTYRMYKDSERELRFPLAVAVSYRNGDRGKHGEVVRSYVACGVTDRSAKQVERLYRKRSGIETTYRYFGKHAGSRRRVIPSCGLRSCWLQHSWRTSGLFSGGRSSPARGRAGATCPRSSRSRRSVTGFVTNWKRSYAAGGRSKRTGLACRRHRKRPRADRSQPTARPSGGE